MTGARGVDAIEFFGLPGAGKTTLAEQVIKGLRERGHSVVSSRDWMGDGRSFRSRTGRRLAMVARELLAKPSMLLEDGLKVVADGGGLKEGLHSGWNQLSVSAMVRRSQRSRVLLILDQGPVQAAWSTALRQDGGRHGSALDRIDPSWLRRTLFVEVATPPEQAREWLSKRQDRTSRLQRAGAIDNDALWRQGADLMKTLSGSLHRRLSAAGLPEQLFRLDGADEPTVELAKKVITHFHALLRPHGALPL